MTSALTNEEALFEEDVLRVARQLWSSPYGGPEMIDSRERDGVFIGEDTIHLVECTVSRTKAKAENDTQKLLGLFEKYRRESPDKAIKGWFVTRDEPTADQRQVAHAHQAKITAVSFDSFRSRLIDVKAYLDARKNYPFGSARDPATNDYKSTDAYVEIGIRAQGNSAHWRVADIVANLERGTRITLLGDYGAGKSSTLREVFRKVSTNVYNKAIAAFPVYLNLRDHHGQSNPAEALFRHAENIGFQHPHHLVRAWRAGYVLLILDGFDEVTGSPWTGKIRKLREARRRALTLVREFVRHTPMSSGVVISGRRHFFDNDREMHEALGMSQSFVVLTLDDFTEKQIEEYLNHKGYSGAVPLWLPTRPLLLGYLVARGVLPKTIQGSAYAAPAEGWDHLIQEVCAREAEIEVGIEGESVRHILEALATLARRAPDGLGPLRSDEISGVFETVIGHPPDEKGALLLQRLPGLGVSSAEESTRGFIDVDFASALRAGPVARYAIDPYNNVLPGVPSWRHPLGEVGMGVAARAIQSVGFTAKHALVAAKHAAEKPAHDFAVLDLLFTADEMGAAVLDSKVYVRDVLVYDFVVPADISVWSNCKFEDSIFARLEITPAVDASTAPTFSRCLIHSLEGRTDLTQLNGILIECDVESVSAGGAQTNAAVLALPVPIGVRVLLTVLKKLFAQRGTGRKQSGLFRGLDSESRRLVDDVLHILVRERVIVASSRSGAEPIWLPVRSMAERVQGILTSNGSVSDSIVTACKKLGEDE